MSYASVVMSLYSVLAVLVMGPPTAEPPFSPAQVAEMLRQSAVASPFETEYEVRTTPLKINGASARPDLEWELLWKIRSTYDRSRMLLETTFTSHRPDGHIHTVQSRSMFDGEKRVAFNDDGIVISDLATAGDMNQIGFLFDYVAGQFPQRPDWVNMIARGRPIDQHIQEGVLIYSFDPDGSGTVTITLEAEREPAFRLLSWETRIPESESNKIVTINRLTFSNWTKENGFMLPQRATLEARAFNRPRFKGKWISTITEYERTQVRTLMPQEVPKSLFTIVYQPGMAVVDQRINLSFVVGERRLHYDGFVYELDEPLMSHPSGRLAELIGKDREPTPLSEFNTGVAQPAQPPRLTGFVRIAAVIVAAFSGAIIILSVFRKILASRKLRGVQS